MVDRERLALALSSSQAKDDEGQFERLGDLLGFSGENKLWRVLDTAVDAILRDLTEQGFAIVPVEPTEAMISFGIAQADDCTDKWTSSAACIAEHVWAAMLSAREG